MKLISDYEKGELIDALKEAIRLIENHDENVGALGVDELVDVILDEAEENRKYVHKLMNYVDDLPF